MKKLIHRTTIAAASLGVLAQTIPASSGLASSGEQISHISVSQDPGPWRRSNPFIATSKNGGNPGTAKSTSVKTSAKIMTQTQDGTIQVQGIMQVDKKFHALINGQAVKAGDMISGYTVKEINRYRVVVLNERKETIIYDIYQGRIDRGKK